MTAQEVITAISEIVYYFSICQKNAAKDSDAHKTFTQWIKALLIILEEKKNEEDDGK
jgi:hypothetical protein